MKFALALLCAPCMLVATASAQEATPAPAPAQPTAPAAPTDIQPAGEVSEDEVSRFALTALVLEQVAADTTLPEEQKQSAIMGVMQQTGLQPQRFNEIALASQSDTGLKQRIETAAKQHIATAQQAQQAQGSPTPGQTEQPAPSR